MDSKVSKVKGNDPIVLRCGACRKFTFTESQLHRWGNISDDTMNNIDMKEEKEEGIVQDSTLNDEERVFSVRRQGGNPLSGALNVTVVNKETRDTISPTSAASSSSSSNGVNEDAGSHSMMDMKSKNDSGIENECGVRNGYGVHRDGNNGTNGCTLIFLEPEEWMWRQQKQGDDGEEEDCEDGGTEVEGKITCGQCGSRLGTWSWRGVQCSCGRWEAPAFYVHSSKVDRVTTRLIGLRVAGAKSIRN